VEVGLDLTFKACKRTISVTGAFLLGDGSSFKPQQ